MEDEDSVLLCWGIVLWRLDIDEREKGRYMRGVSSVDDLPSSFAWRSSGKSTTTNDHSIQRTSHETKSILYIPFQSIRYSNMARSIAPMNPNITPISCPTDGGGTYPASAIVLNYRREMLVEEIEKQ